jgi:hypothetical protein
MDLINFEHIVLSKLHPFKNTDGRYCFVNYNKNESVNISLKNVEVAYDSNGTILLLILTGTEVFTFMNELKESLISQVYEKHIYSNTPIESLYEFYVSPHKISKNGKDLLKCKCSEIFDKATKVNVNIHISGMWFSKTSFGPYFLIKQIEKVPNVCLITDSDSDTEINI